ncbi:MAG TPA: hypothetical protein VEL31_14125 [Ktedonobacteraceae bacterium]|nr:hypothetical protein [Ktedonobacteraceae bacterium]
MPRLKPAPGYITAKEALAMLSISDATLSTYVKKGWLKRYGPSGRQHLFYKLSEVEALKESRNTFDEYKEKLPAFFSQATPEDIPAIAAIDEATFNQSEKGKEGAEPREVYLHWIGETYLRWMTKNPDVFSVLRNTANTVVGFASLLPMKKETMDRFVKGEMKMADIPSEDIELFETGKPLHLYVIALCIDPAYKAATKEEYGARMVRGLFAFLLELAQRGVEIDTITARNEKDKPDGKRLLQKLGIPQLRSPVSDMYLFSVRVTDSGYPMLVKYCNVLAEWKREHLTTR